MEDALPADGQDLALIPLISIVLSSLSLFLPPWITEITEIIICVHEEPIEVERERKRLSGKFGGEMENAGLEKFLEKYANCEVLYRMQMVHHTADRP